MKNPAPTDPLSIAVAAVATIMNPVPVGGFRDHVEIDFRIDPPLRLWGVRIWYRERTSQWKLTTPNEEGRLL